MPLIAYQLGNILVRSHLDTSEEDYLAYRDAQKGNANGSPLKPMLQSSSIYTC